MKDYPPTPPPTCTGKTGEALKQCLCEAGTCTDLLYFFHSNHIGSSTFLTDFSGQPYEYILYLPFGELLVNQKVGPYETPYKFTGKESDPETELTYFGARYYDAALGIWLGVDPLADEFPSWSPYSYTFNNPLRFIDHDGRAPDDIILRGKNNSSVTLKTDLIDVNVNVSSLGVDFGGNYTLEGEAVLSAGLDLVGIVDPTGVADGLNAGLQAKNGDWGGALISSFGLIPYVGDIAKVGKIGKDIKIIENAIDAVKTGDNVKGATKGTDYVVTPKGEAIKIPDGAKGPTNPNKGSGMVYQGGSGGKGMDSRTTGVRIMDANSNQGRRVNYMNKSGQTVDPSTGRTISNKDPRGHLPLKDY